MEFFRGSILNIKSAFLEIWYMLGYLELLAFMGIFLLFFLLFFLGAVGRNIRFGIPYILVLASFFVIGVAPFAIKFLIKDELYKVDVQYQRASKLEYVDVFFIDAKLKNIGRREIGECVLTLRVLQNQDGYFGKIKNFFKPLEVRKFIINGPISVGEEKNIVVNFLDFKSDLNTKIDVDCYGK